MAVDKLVDSTQLDTDLTSVANAIRTKGGTSAQLAFPAGFVSAIDAIPTGGGGDTLVIKGQYQSYLDWSQGYPTKYKIESEHFEYLGFRTNIVEETINIEEIELDVSGLRSGLAGITVVLDMRANAVHALKKVNLNFAPLANIYAVETLYGVNKDPYFEDLLGLNFIAVGGGNYKIGSFSNLGALKNITCKPNTLGQLDMVATDRNRWSLPASSLLTDASLCQIANALCATYTSTLTLHATPKARCQTLMGIVSSVTDDTGTYDFFTADANGTVSLADFITQTKGWTLA